MLPALRDLALIRRLKCSWGELQEMPEELVEVWEAIFAGEDHAQREKAAAAAAANR